MISWPHNCASPVRAGERNRFLSCRRSPHVDASLMSTLGPDALSVSRLVDDLVVPRNRCCDVEGQVAVHLDSTPTETASRLASRVSDAGSFAALPSSPCQCFVDNIPVLGSIDGFQGDRGIRRSVDRLEARHQPRSPVSGTNISWCVVDPFERWGRFLSMSSQALAVGHAVQIRFLCRRLALFHASRTVMVIRLCFRTKWISLFARALAGGDVVSANLYRLRRERNPCVPAKCRPRRSLLCSRVFLRPPYG